MELSIFNSCMIRINLADMDDIMKSLWGEESSAASADREENCDRALLRYPQSYNELLSMLSGFLGIDETELCEASYDEQISQIVAGLNAHAAKDCAIIWMNDDTLDSTDAGFYEKTNTLLMEVAHNVRFEKQDNNTKDKRVTIMACTSKPPNTEVIEAEKAIREKYLLLECEHGPLALGEEMPHISLHQDITQIIGYHKQFEFGVIYYTKEFGACMLKTALHKRYLEEGGPYGALGWPCSDHGIKDDKVSCISFACDQEETASIYQSAQGNVFLLKGKIRDKWLSLGGLNSPIGFPVSEVTFCNDNHRQYVDFGFNGTASATISNIASTNTTCMVTGPIWERWRRPTWDLDEVPATDEQVALVYGKECRFVHFMKHWRNWYSVY